MSMKYCTNCGKQIAEEADTCPFCRQKTTKKDNNLLDYMFNHIKTDLKSRTDDKAISIIKNYILSHLYGSVLVISIMTVAIGSAVVPGPKADEAVRNRPDVVIIDDYLNTGYDYEISNNITDSLNYLLFQTSEADNYIYSPKYNDVNYHYYYELGYNDIMYGVYKNELSVSREKFVNPISIELSDQGFNTAEGKIFIAYANGIDESGEDLGIVFFCLMDFVAVEENGIWKFTYINAMGEFDGGEY